MTALALGLLRKAKATFLKLLVSSKSFYVQKKLNQPLRIEIKLKCKYFKD